MAVFHLVRPLDLPERRIILDDEGKVDHIHVPDRLDAHKLIEECMIQANAAAAELPPALVPGFGGVCLANLSTERPPSETHANQ